MKPSPGDLADVSRAAQHDTAVHVLAGEAAFDFSFADGACSFDVGAPHLCCPVDPFPGYHHDPALVADVLEHVTELWPPAGRLEMWLPDREVIGRSNGFAQRDWSSTGEMPGDERRTWGAHIVLSGKRTPLHPAMTRFLVAHEYGHHVEWWIEALLGFEEGAVRQDYANLRGLDARRAAGGRWHSAVGEVLADDFRVLIAGAELEHWPHPGIERPGAAEAEWWSSARSCYLEAAGR